ncbi:MAG: ferritin-like domain-containing protein [Chloroflexota bacterium]|nr:ferritin-like domain-containing protein [Chloroflexota bacterium]
MTQDNTNPEVRERLMTAIAVERTRLGSRRGFLTNAAKIAGGGALALAAVPATGSMRAVLAQGEDFADDLEILNYALTLEHLEYAFYRDGLELFSEDDFVAIDEDDEDQDDDEAEDDEEDESEDDEESDEDDGAEIYGRLEEIRDHEQAHVDFLTQTVTDLGGEPVVEGEYDFGYGDDPVAFLEIAQALENTGVAAYAGAGPQIQDAGIVAAALSIHSVEARHAGYLNDINGETPFPDAFDEPLSRDEVLEIAGEFIVDDGSDDEEPTEEAAAEDDATEAPAEGDATEEPAEGDATEAPTEAPAATDPPAATEAPTEVPATEEPTEETEDDVEVPATSTP